MPGRPNKKIMSRCDHCGKETALPFSCQHCGGKFCEEHRLPPNHNCINIGSWNSKTRPAIGLNYGKGGSVTVTGGGYLPDQRRNTKQIRAERLPWLKIVVAIVALVLLGLAWLVLSGYRFG
jgi:hypothetical protein